MAWNLTRALFRSLSQEVMSSPVRLVGINPVESVGFTQKPSQSLNLFHDGQKFVNFVCYTLFYAGFWQDERVCL